MTETPDMPLRYDMRPPNGNSLKYVSYKWLITTLLGTALGIFILVGSVASAIFYPKDAGSSLETSLISITKQLDEVHSDIKTLLHGRSYGETLGTPRRR